MHQRFLAALSQGFVPAGEEEAQALLDDECNQESEQDLMDELRQVSNKYNLADFDVEKFN